MQGGGSQDDLLQGVSPSSTIRDLEAACGPLSAASGLLETTSLPPAKDAAILPLLWARLVSSLLQFSELQPLLLHAYAIQCMPMPDFACLCHTMHAYAIPCMPMPYVACTHSLLCTLFSSAVKGGLGCMQNTSHFWCHGQGMVTKSAWIVSSGASMSPA